MAKTSEVFCFVSLRPAKDRNVIFMLNLQAANCRKMMESSTSSAT